MNDGELVEFVLAFTGEVNALQRRYAPLLAAERERGRTAAFLEAYRAEAGLIYARYLTGRERTYYAPISDPPTYAAMEVQAGVRGRSVADQQLPAAHSHGVLHPPVDLRRLLISGRGTFPVRFFCPPRNQRPLFSD